MLESGMRIVGMLAADKAKAVSRPENLSDGRARSVRGIVRDEKKWNVRRSGFSNDHCELAFPCCVLEECFDSFRMSDRENEFAISRLVVSNESEDVKKRSVHSPRMNMVY